MKTTTKTKKTKLPRGLNANPVLMDIMMVIDIDRSVVTEELFEYLLDNHVTYRDQVIKEHLININDALDECPSRFRVAIRTLNKIADNQKAAYIRFVNRF